MQQINRKPILEIVTEQMRSKGYDSTFSIDKLRDYISSVFIKEKIVPDPQNLIAQYSLFKGYVTEDEYGEWIKRLVRQRAS